MKRLEYIQLQRNNAGGKAISWGLGKTEADSCHSRPSAYEAAIGTLHAFC
jgi:hypothetical protein